MKDTLTSYQAQLKVLDRQVGRQYKVSMHKASARHRQTQFQPQK